MKISISTKFKKLPYYKNCTEFSRRDTDKKGGLSDMIGSGVDISYKTFRSHIDTKTFDEIAKDLGYDKNLKIQDDWAVYFRKSTLFGKTVYYMRQSGIEYIFGDF